LGKDRGTTPKGVTGGGQVTTLNEKRGKGNIEPTTVPTEPHPGGKNEQLLKRRSDERGGGGGGNIVHRRNLPEANTSRRGGCEPLPYQSGAREQEKTLM